MARPFRRADTSDSLDSAFSGIVDLSLSETTRSASPLFHLVPRHEPGGGEDPKEEAAALALQRFWRRGMAQRRQVQRLLSALKSLGTLETDLSPLTDFADAVDAKAAEPGPGDKLSEAMSFFGDPSLVRRAAALVAHVDEGVSAKKRATRARSHQAFLSSFLVVAFPADTLAYSDEAELQARGLAPAVDRRVPPLESDQYTMTQKRLYNAARLQRMSVRRLQAELAAPETPGTNGWAFVNRVTAATAALRFFRNYAVYSFAKWRFEDSERLAAGIIQQYASAFAMAEGLRIQLGGPEALAAGIVPPEMQAVLVDADAQLASMAAAIRRLIGPKKAAKAIAETTTAVRDDVRAQLAALEGANVLPQGTSEAAREATTTSAASAQGTTAPATRPPVAPPAGTTTRASSADAGGPAIPSPIPTSVPASPPRTARTTRPRQMPPSPRSSQTLSSANEVLAHEILLNPHLRLVEDPGAPAGGPSLDPLGDPARLRQVLGLAPSAGAGGASGDMPLPPFPWEAGAASWAMDDTSRTPANVARIAHRAFWDAFIEQLLPPADDAAESAPPQLDMLVGNLKEVGEALEGLTPRNSRLVNEAREALQPESLVTRLAATLLQPRALLGEVATTVRFAVRRLRELIAPVRGTDYDAWAEPMLRRFDRWIGVDGSEADAAWTECARSLPAVLSRLLAAASLTKADALQAQVEALRPVLRIHGAGYEQGKFLARLREDLGATQSSSMPASEVLRALPTTKRVLTMLLASRGHVTDPTAHHVLKAGEWQHLHETASLAGLGARAPEGSFLALLRGGGVRLRAAGGALVGHATLLLLQAPVRLDAQPEGVVPEVLMLDASRLAKARDALDRTCLVVALATLTQQVALRNGRAFGLAPMQHLVSRLNVLVQDVHGGAGGVGLTALIDECVAAAGGGAPEAPLPAQEVAALRTLLPKAASADHPIFALVQKRVLGAWVRFLPFNHPQFFEEGQSGVAASLEGAARDAGVAGVGRVAPGLSSTELGRELVAVGDALSRVMRHCLTVHGDMLTGLLQHLAREEA